MAFLKGFGTGLLLIGAFDLITGSSGWAIGCFILSAISFGFVRAAGRAA